MISDKDCGVSKAAPIPWTTRAAISISIPPDGPHHNEAAVNTARPIRYRFLRPNRSPNRPAISNGTAYASRYALVSQITMS